MLLLLAFSSIALAQPLPKIDSISPEWVQRGENTTITISGDNLGQVSGFIISGDPGVKAELTSSAKPAIRLESSGGGVSAIELRDEKRITAKLSVAADASLEERELRLVTPTGVSNPMLLHVGHLPEVAEGSPHQTAEHAQKVVLPVAISGRISAAAEVDYYRFEAKKGQDLVFDVFASRLGSPMDSSLALLDRSGKELARNEDFNGLDSLLEFKVPEDGEYILQLRDLRFEGGADYRYRLLAGALPYVYSVFPYGGRRGQTVEVDVRGHNFDRAKLMLRIETTAPAGRQDIRVSTLGGVSNPFPFDITDLPESTEKEPNETAEQATLVQLPVAINGRIQSAKDRDVFKFKVEKDQQFIFEILANRFGSPLDALMTLSNSRGSVLQRNDDAIGADARIEQRFTEAGEYILTVEDLLQRGGENFGYRLTIRQPEPDFTVRFLPDNPRIHRGGHAPVRCELTRFNGFNETVRVSFADLAAGLFCEPLLLTPGGTQSGILVISATKECPLGTVPLKLTSKSVVNGKALTRSAEALSNDKPVREAFLTVLEEAPFNLILMTATASAEQGQSAAIEIEAVRQENFSSEIKLTAEGFSAGREPITQSFDIPAVTLKGSESRGQVNLKAKLNSETGTRPVLIKAEAVLEGRTITEYSPSFPITVSQIPFVLTTSLKRFAITALPSAIQSAAREAVFAVKAERRAGFNGEIALRMDGLPEGVIASIDKIPSGMNETNVRLVATEKAPMDKEFTLRIEGAGQFRDRTFKQQTSEVKLSIASPVSEPGTVKTVEAK